MHSLDCKRFVIIGILHYVFDKIHCNCIYVSNNDITLTKICIALLTAIAKMWPFNVIFDECILCTRSHDKQNINMWKNVQLFFEFVFVVQCWWTHVFSTLSCKYWINANAFVLVGLHVWILKLDFTSLKLKK